MSTDAPVLSLRDRIIAAQDIPSQMVTVPEWDGIEIKVEKQTNIQVTGSNKGLVGQVAAKIRGFRPPEPYLGKGVKYTDEKIRRKEGKSAGK